MARGGKVEGPVLSDEDPLSLGQRFEERDRSQVISVDRGEECHGERD